MSSNNQPPFKGLTDIQLKIVELMKDSPLKRYDRVCYVDGQSFNANSVKSLIKKGIIQFYVHDKANGWDYYELSDQYRASIGDSVDQPVKQLVNN